MAIMTVWPLFGEHVDAGRGDLMPHAGTADELLCLRRHFLEIHQHYFEARMCPGDLYSVNTGTAADVHQ